MSETKRNEEPKVTTPRANPSATGDNRGADDVDGNKAGAKTGNKAPGPNDPETPTESNKP
jgi:hypothetical protein